MSVIGTRLLQGEFGCQDSGVRGGGRNREEQACRFGKRLGVQDKRGRGPLFGVCFLIEIKGSLSEQGQSHTFDWTSPEKMGSDKLEIWALSGAMRW